MSAPRWYERAEEQLDRDYTSGLIDDAEYQEQIRELNNQLREAAEEAAHQAYDDYMGAW